MGNKPKLAVISTWKTACGIAAFAHKMVPGFEEKFDVEVFPLDQSIIKANEKKIIKLGDKIIKGIADRLKEFDLVNIQFEPGIFGNHPKDIFRRLFKLIDNSPKCFITFHTVKQGTKFRYSTLTRLAFTKPIRAVDYWNTRGLDIQYVKMYAKLNTPRYKNVFCHYHTRSAQRYVNVRYPNIKTIDFPLTFISKPEKARYKANVEKDRQWILDSFDLPQDTVLVSCYGFISKYKGFDTIIRAIYQLPDNYKLCIFGAIHPNAIEPFKYTNEYLGNLLGLIDRKAKGIPDIVEDLLESDKELSFSLQDIKKLYAENDDHIKINKVLFGGSLSDDDFERAINGSDINVMSYLEVGQTSSGPIAISLDLEKNTIATYNKCFLQLKKYAPNCFDQFDIGNHVQLRKLIELHTIGKNDMSGLPAYSQNISLENRVEQIYQAYLDIPSN
ncbi:MAG: hypothetical protein HKN51_15915 [Saprospiraceae bacterium]|nr:hypothetical protein [Saprospiraceae bacterium]